MVEGPPFKRKVEGSIPSTCRFLLPGCLMVGRETLNLVIGGSIPSPAGLVVCAGMVEWQTRSPQERVAARSCRFNSYFRQDLTPPSSSGQGHRFLKPKTWVRLLLGVGFRWRRRLTVRTLAFQASNASSTLAGARFFLM